MATRVTAIHVPGDGTFVFHCRRTEFEYGPRPVDSRLVVKTREDALTFVTPREAMLITATGRTVPPLAQCVVYDVLVGAEDIEGFLRLAGLDKDRDVLEALFAGSCGFRKDLRAMFMRLGARLVHPAVGGHSVNVVNEFIGKRFYLHPSEMSLYEFATHPDWYDALVFVDHVTGATPHEWLSEVLVRVTVVDDGAARAELLRTIDPSDVIAWRAFALGRHLRDSVARCRDLMRVIARFVLPPRTRARVA